MDELWALGDVLMVIPVVPHDCPSALEFALRLRRDAMLTGICDKCGAAARAESVPVDTDTPMSTAVFDHKMFCPARDDSVLPLLREYRAAKSDQSERDRFDAAQRTTRSVVAPLKNFGIEMRGAPSEQIAQDVLQRLTRDGAARCDHLAADPYQTWYTFIAMGNWRCKECYAAFESKIPGALDPIEDHTCDLCRRYAPTTLTSLVLRIDFFVMRGAACSRCSATYSPADTATISER